VDRLGAGYEAAYRRILSRTAAVTTPAGAGGDALQRLRREYGELDAALDRRYSRSRRRHSGATHSRTTADRGIDRMNSIDRTAGRATEASTA